MRHLGYLFKQDLYMCISQNNYMVEINKSFTHLIVLINTCGFCMIESKAVWYHQIEKGKNKMRSWHEEEDDKWEELKGASIRLSGLEMPLVKDYTYLGFPFFSSLSE